MYSYTEKHYGEGDGTGGKIMNPQTIVYLEEGASIQMETVQIRGIDSTKRETKIVCGKDTEAVVTERLHDPRQSGGRKRHGDRAGRRRRPWAGHLPLRGQRYLPPDLLSQDGGQ